MCVCVRSKGKAKKTKEIRTSARPNLQKMWRVDRIFFFGGGSEPGTGARPTLEKMWRERGDRDC